MDREELEERIRGRRPGDSGFRRGSPVDDAPGIGGYVPFQPEPEDALAAHEPELPGGGRHVDNMTPETDAEPPERPSPYARPVEPPAFEPPVYPPPAYDPAAGQAAYAEPSHAQPGYDERSYPETGYEPEEYPYGHPQRPEGGGRRGGGALPVIGFVALCALALAVGAVLAGIIGGPNQVGQATPTPTGAAASATPIPTPGSTAAASSPGNATPEPTDGPVAFADGASITVQPCATAEMSFDGCAQDGSVVSGKNMWVWIGFKKALGTDKFVLELRSAGQTIDQQEKALGQILDCPDRCSGYLIGAAYRDLGPGEYELVVRRNGDFADRATFRVGG